FAQLDWKIHFLTAAIDRDAHLIARPLFVQNEIYVELHSNFLTVYRDDYVSAHVKSAHADCRDAVAAVNSCLRCRPTAWNGLHKQAFLNEEIKHLAKSAANDERIYSEIGLINPTINNQIVGDTFCDVDRNCEANARCRAGRRVNRGVDADDFTMRIDERPAGIASVNCCVSLDRFINESCLAGLYGAAQRAYDACCERTLKTKRISDSENFLADLNRGRIAERQRDEWFFLGHYFYESNVVARIRAHDCCWITRLIAKNNFNRLGAFDHVIIRENESLGIDDEARPRAFDGDRVHEKVVFRGLRQNIC